MPRGKSKKIHDITIDAYAHAGKKRVNNPPVGLVSSATDKLNGKTRYQHDPHIDPALSWAGKAEGMSFEVQNVSLHIHERIDPRRIIKNFLKPKEKQPEQQLFMFEQPENQYGLAKELDFYKHDKDWSNRLIAGDSLLVMNSLLKKEGMAGKVQMVYIDPPYGIKYNSNFQPFVNKRDVKDGNDADIPAEPEMIQAFRDTWELGIHSYLTYLRDRLLLAREMLTEKGSCFVQISDENVHHVRELMDEVFGKDNFVALITYKTATNQNAKRIQRLYDHIVWYGKTQNIKFNSLYRERTHEEIENVFNNIDEKTGRRYKAAQLDYEEDELQRLEKAGRLIENGKYGKRYFDDFIYSELDSVWQGTIISTFSKEKVYVVQTSTIAIQRCLLMTTEPGDIVFDPTCGSGTTAFVAEQWGRRWITCDTSRVAITLAKQRLMTARFDYYQLAHPHEGINSGFKYKTVPHITLGSIANNEPAKEETLYDKPFVEKGKVRVTGPFTVEAVPSLRVKPFDGSAPKLEITSEELARTGETGRQAEWRDELKATGIRTVGGKVISFSRVEPMLATRFLHAEAEVLDSDGTLKRAYVSFGPDFGALEQRQVEEALKEARTLKNTPAFVVFAAFHFDPEAAKDIDQVTWPGVKILKAQMSVDLLTKDLRKKRSSSHSYWLIGQPEVDVKKTKDGTYFVVVKGFDYYNPANGEIESKGTKNIAMWFLDADYDERSLYPDQVFFPEGDSKRDWSRLAKALNGEVNEELLEQFSGIESLPFAAGENRKIAVKIVDNRGIESFVIKELE